MPVCATCKNMVDFTAKRCPQCGAERQGLILSAFTCAILTLILGAIVILPLNYILPWDIYNPNNGFNPLEYFIIIIGVVLWLRLTFKMWWS